MRMPNVWCARCAGTFTITVHVRTFIHQETIEEPPLVPGFACKGPGYGYGDDRGPMADPGDRYRTQVRITSASAGFWSRRVTDSFHSRVPADRVFVFDRLHLVSSLAQFLCDRCDFEFRRACAQ